MVELQFSKLIAGVRFSHPALSEAWRTKGGMSFVPAHEAWRIEGRSISRVFERERGGRSEDRADGGSKKL